MLHIEQAKKKKKKPKQRLMANLKRIEITCVQRLACLEEIYLQMSAGILMNLIFALIFFKSQRA